MNWVALTASTLRTSIFTLSTSFFSMSLIKVLPSPT